MAENFDESKMDHPIGPTLSASLYADGQEKRISIITHSEVVLKSGVEREKMITLEEQPQINFTYKKAWLHVEPEFFWSEYSGIELEKIQALLKKKDEKQAPELWNVIKIGEWMNEAGYLSKAKMLSGLGAYFLLPTLLEIKLDEIDVQLLHQVPIQFVKQHTVLPLYKKEDGVLVVAMADPTDLVALDELRRVLDVSIFPFVCLKETLLEITNKIYSQRRVDAELEGKGGSKEEETSEEEVDLVDLSDEAPIIRWVNSILFHAVRVGASDIHFEPHEKDLVVRYRIDGVLQEYKRVPKQFSSAISARVKIMAGVNIAEKRLPQDGRIRRKIAGKDIDMRVATAPTGYGERITIRLLDKTAVRLDLGELGFAEDQLSMVKEIINRPHGIFLVTGPTGSGKTTTLYAALSQINVPDINIMTVEDPIEYQLDGISQIQVNPKIELTFASAIRSFLRHDPDVIMVGEIRDQETAGMAVTASLTGHLVFSTVHTNDAAGAITRLIDMGIEPFLVVSSLSGILAQRLVRRLCVICRELYTPSKEEVLQLGFSMEEFIEGKVRIPSYKTKVETPPVGLIYRAKEGGCKRCAQTGYQGRLAIYELLIVNEELRNLALKKTDSQQLRKIALAHGMRTLRKDGAYKVLLGMTSLQEVLLMTTEEGL